MVQERQLDEIRENTSARHAATSPSMPASRDDKAMPGTWTWLKEWTGYIVTVLPYVSAALVLIPGLRIATKFAILVLFCVFVVCVRVLHEKAGIEVTSEPQRAKRPGDDS